MRTDGVADQSAPGGVSPSGDYGALRRLYAGYAPRYDRRFARYSEATLSRAMTLLGERPPERLVDVACGTGLLAERVRRRWPGTSIVGVDLSPDMLARAAARIAPAASPHRPETAWLEGAAEALPVATESADVLVCTNAFHLVQRPVDALAEFRRVLRPGGRLVLIDWCRDFRSMRALLLLLAIVRRQRRRCWTLAELRTAVRRAGFEESASDRFRVGAFWGLMSLVGVRR